MIRRSILAFLLALVFLTLCGHAQSETTKSSIQFDSFGATPNGDFRARADVFMQELSSQPDSRALIIIFGSPAQIASRKRLISNHFSFFRKFPLSRVDVTIGGNVSAFRTEFWIIPAGAEAPELKPEGWIFGEIGQAYKSRASIQFDKFLAEVKRLEDHQAFVINYGSPQQIALREQWLRDALRRVFNYHWPRLTFVNGGPGPVRTVMWLVPPGAENPKP